MTAFTVLVFGTGCQIGGDGGLPVNQIVNGTVTKVHDGDSIHITPTGEKRVIVRLAGIDAPEIGQQHGYKSRDYLRHEILNREVEARCTKTDKYNRQICLVLFENTDINLQMLNAGLAWYYTKYSHEQSGSHQRAYRKAESKAKKQQRGLWQSSDAIAPWEFRSGATTAHDSGNRDSTNKRSKILEFLK